MRPTDSLFFDPASGDAADPADPLRVSGGSASAPGSLFLDDDSDSGSLFLDDDATPGSLFLDDDATPGSLFLDDDATPGSAKIDSLFADPEASFRVLGLPMSASRIRQFEGGEDLLAILELQERRSRGFVESVTDFTWADAPLINDIAGIVIPVQKMREVGDTFKRMAAGEEVSDQERILAQLYLTDAERRAQAGVGGMVGDMVRQMPGFMMEIGLYAWVSGKLGGSAGLIFGGPVVGAATGLGSGVVGGLSRAVWKGSALLGRTVARKQVSKAMNKYLTTIAGKPWVRELGTRAALSLETGTELFVADAAVSALGNAAMGRSAFDSRQAEERMIHSALTGSDLDLDKARMMAMGDRYIEFLSEASGGMLGHVFHLPGSGRWMKKAFERGWGPSHNAGAVRRQVEKGVLGTKLAEIAKRSDIDLDAAFGKLTAVGYDGYIQEMMEERFGGFLRGAFGLEGDDEGGFRNALDQMFPELDQLKAEAIAFAIPPLGIIGSRQAQHRLRGDVPVWDQNIRTVAAGLQSMGPETWVEVFDPKEVRRDASGREAASPRQVHDALGWFHEQENAMPEGMFRRAAIHVISAAEGILTGTLTGHPGIRSADQALIAYGRTGLVSVYGQAVANYEAEMAGKGMTEAEIAEGAKEAAINALAPAFSRWRETVVMTDSVYDAAGIAKEKLDDPAFREEIANQLNAEALKEDGKLDRIPLEDGGHAYLIRGTDPTGKAISDIDKMLESIHAAVSPGLAQAQIDVSNGKPLTMSAIGRMDTDLDDLNDAYENPYSPQALVMAGMAGIDLHIKGGITKFRNMITTQKAWLEKGGFGNAMQHEEGGDVFLQPMGQDEEGRFQFRAVLQNATDAAKGALHDAGVREAGLISAKADNQADALLQVMRDLEKQGYVEDSGGFPNRQIYLTRTTTVSAKTAEQLANAFPGYTPPSKDNPTEVFEKHARKHLNARKDKTGRWYTRLGALNNMHQVAIVVHAQGYHAWEDMSESRLKVSYGYRTNFRSRDDYQYSPEVKRFIEDAAEVIDNLLKAEDTPDNRTLQQLLKTEDNIEATIKLFAFVFAGWGETTEGSEALPYQRELAGAADALKGLSSASGFVRSVANDIGILNAEGEVTAEILQAEMHITEGPEKRERFAKELNSFIREVVEAVDPDADTDADADTGKTPPGTTPPGTTPTQLELPLGGEPPTTYERQGVPSVQPKEGRGRPADVDETQYWDSVVEGIISKGLAEGTSTKEILMAINRISTPAGLFAMGQQDTDGLFRYIDARREAIPPSQRVAVAVEELSLEEQYAAMGPTEIKALLKKRGLPVTGRPDAVRARLLASEPIPATTQEAEAAPATPREAELDEPAAKPETKESLTAEITERGKKRPQTTASPGSVEFDAEVRLQKEFDYETRTITLQRDTIRHQAVLRSEDSTDSEKSASAIQLLGLAKEKYKRLKQGIIARVEEAEDRDLNDQEEDSLDITRLKMMLEAYIGVEKYALDSTFTKENPNIVNDTKATLARSEQEYVDNYGHEATTPTKAKPPDALAAYRAESDRKIVSDSPDATASTGAMREGERDYKREAEERERGGERTIRGERKRFFEGEREGERDYKREEKETDERREGEKREIRRRRERRDSGEGRREGREKEESDRKFLELAKDPEANEAELLRVVIEAAKRAGDRFGRLWHGGREGPEFTLEKSDMDSFSFTDAKSLADIYARRRGHAESKAYFLFIENLQHHDGTTEAQPEPVTIKETLRPHDGRVHKEGIKSSSDSLDRATIYKVTDPSIIKSADPVTYDDQGNVIPLSKRFDLTTRKVDFSVDMPTQPRPGTPEGTVGETVPGAPSKLTISSYDPDTETEVLKVLQDPENEALRNVAFGGVVRHAEEQALEDPAVSVEEAPTEEEAPVEIMTLTDLADLDPSKFPEVAEAEPENLPQSAFDYPKSTETGTEEPSAEGSPYGDWEAFEILKLTAYQSVTEWLRLYVGGHGYEGLNLAYEVTHGDMGERLADALRTAETYKAWYSSTSKADTEAEKGLKLLAATVNAEAIPRRRVGIPRNYMVGFLSELQNRRRLFGVAVSALSAYGKKGAEAAALTVGNVGEPVAQHLLRVESRRDELITDYKKVLPDVLESFRAAVKKHLGEKEIKAAKSNKHLLDLGYVGKVLRENEDFRNAMFDALSALSGEPVRLFQAAFDNHEARAMVVATVARPLYHNLAYRENQPGKGVPNAPLSSLHHGGHKFSQAEVESLVNTQYRYLFLPVVHAKTKVELQPGNIKRILESGILGSEASAPSMVGRGSNKQYSTWPYDSQELKALEEYLKSTKSELSIGARGVVLLKEIQTMSGDYVPYADAGVLAQLHANEYMWTQGYFKTHSAMGGKMSTAFVKYPNKYREAPKTIAQEYRELYDSDEITHLERESMEHPDSVDAKVEAFLQQKIKDKQISREVAEKGYAAVYPLLEHVISRLVSGPITAYAGSLTETYPDLFKTVGELSVTEFYKRNPGFKLTDAETRKYEGGHDIVRLLDQTLSLWSKRDGNNLTGGMRSLVQVGRERFLANPERGHTDIDVLMVNDDYVAKRIDGAVFFSGATGEAASRAFGPAFAGGKMAASLKVQVRHNPEELGAVLDKLHAINIESMRDENGEWTDPVYERVAEAMERTGADFIFVYGAAEKVPTETAYSMGFSKEDRVSIFNEDGSLKDTPTIGVGEEAKEISWDDVSGLKRQVPGDAFQLSQKLHSLTQPKVNELPKQFVAIFQNVFGELGHTINNLFASWANAPRTRDPGWVEETIKEKLRGSPHLADQLAAVTAGTSDVFEPGLLMRMRATILSALNDFQPLGYGTNPIDVPDPGNERLPSEPPTADGKGGKTSQVRVTFPKYENSPTRDKVATRPAMALPGGQNKSDDAATQERKIQEFAAELFYTEFLRSNPKLDQGTLKEMLRDPNRFSELLDAMADKMGEEYPGLWIPLTDIFHTEVNPNGVPAEPGQMAFEMRGGVPWVPAGAPKISLASGRPTIESIDTADAVGVDEKRGAYLRGVSFLGVRIPKSGFPSTTLLRREDGFFDGASFLQMPLIDAIAKGSDYDGDKTRTLLIMSTTYDNSQDGHLARIDRLIKHALKNDPVMYAEAHNKLEELNDMFKAAAAEMTERDETYLEKVPTAKNSIDRWKWDDYNTRIGEAAINIGAKSIITFRIGLQMGMHIGPGTVVLPGVSVDGEAVELGYTEEDAKRFITGKDPDFYRRMLLAESVAAETVVSAGLDNEKNRVLAPLRLDRFLIPIASSALMFSKFFRKTEGTYNPEAEREAAAEYVKKLLVSLAANGLIRKVQEKYSEQAELMETLSAEQIKKVKVTKRPGGVPESFTRPNHREILLELVAGSLSEDEGKEYDALMEENLDEVKARIENYERNPYREVDEFLLSTELGTWVHMYDLGQDLYGMGQFSDMQVGDPQNLNEIPKLEHEIARVKNIRGVLMEGDGYTDADGVKPLRELKLLQYASSPEGMVPQPGQLDPAIAFQVAALLAERLEDVSYLHTPGGQAIYEALKEDVDVGDRKLSVFPSMRTVPAFGTLDLAIQTSVEVITVRDMVREYQERTGETINPNFSAARFEKLHDTYPENALIRLLARQLPPDQEEGAKLEALQLAYRFSGTNALKIPADEKAAAQRDFGEFPEQLQLELAVHALYHYGIVHTAVSGSYRQLLGHPTDDNSQFRRKRVDAFRLVREQGLLEDPGKNANLEEIASVLADMLSRHTKSYFPAEQKHGSRREAMINLFGADPVAVAFDETGTSVKAPDRSRPKNRVSPTARIRGHFGISEPGPSPKYERPKDEITVEAPPDVSRQQTFNVTYTKRGKSFQGTVTFDEKGRQIAQTGGLTESYDLRRANLEAFQERLAEIRAENEAGNLDYTMTMVVPEAVAGTFEIVSRSASDVSAMRAKSGTAHMNNVDKKAYGKKDSGWLGNPYGEDVDRFRVAFLEKVETDPAFRAAVLDLRGKKVGYYKPSEEENHVRVVQEWLTDRSAQEAAPSVEYVDELTPALLRENPDKVYLFGDNLVGKGKAGQAVIRDEPNAIGIPTKKAPSMAEGSFFTDAEFEENKAAIDAAFERIPAGKTVVIPSAGIGTGLAKLQENAPKTFEYIQGKLSALAAEAAPPSAALTEAERVDREALDILGKDPESVTASLAAIDPNHPMLQAWNHNQIATALDDRGEDSRRNARELANILYPDTPAATASVANALESEDAAYEYLKNTKGWVLTPGYVAGLRKRGVKFDIDGYPRRMQIITKDGTKINFRLIDELDVEQTAREQKKIVRGWGRMYRVTSNRKLLRAMLPVVYGDTNRYRNALRLVPDRPRSAGQDASWLLTRLRHEVESLRREVRRWAKDVSIANPEVARQAEAIAVMLQKLPEPLALKLFAGPSATVHRDDPARRFPSQKGEQIFSAVGYERSGEGRHVDPSDIMAEVLARLPKEAHGSLVKGLGFNFLRRAIEGLSDSIPYGEGRAYRAKVEKQLPFYTPIDPGKKRIETVLTSLIEALTETVMDVLPAVEGMGALSREVSMLLGVAEPTGALDKYVDKLIQKAQILLPSDVTELTEYGTRKTVVRHMVKNYLVSLLNEPPVYKLRLESTSDYSVEEDKWVINPKGVRVAAIRQGEGPPSSSELAKSVEGLFPGNSLQRVEDDLLTTEIFRASLDIMESVVRALQHPVKSWMARKDSPEGVWGADAMPPEYDVLLASSPKFDVRPDIFDPRYDDPDVDVQPAPRGLAWRENVLGMLDSPVGVLLLDSVSAHPLSKSDFKLKYGIPKKDMVKAVNAERDARLMTQRGQVTDFGLIHSITERLDIFSHLPADAIGLRSAWADAVDVDQLLLAQWWAKQISRDLEIWTEPRHGFIDMQTGNIRREVPEEDAPEGLAPPVIPERLLGHVGEIFSIFLEDRGIDTTPSEIVDKINEVRLETYNVELEAEEAKTLNADERAEIALNLPRGELDAHTAWQLRLTPIPEGTTAPPVPEWVAPPEGYTQLLTDADALNDGTVKDHCMKWNAMRWRTVRGDAAYFHFQPPGTTEYKEGYTAELYYPSGRLGQGNQLLGYQNRAASVEQHREVREFGNRLAEGWRREREAAERLLAAKREAEAAAEKKGDPTASVASDISALDPTSLESRRALMVHFANGLGINNPEALISLMVRISQSSGPRRDPVTGRLLTEDDLWGQLRIEGVLDQGQPDDREHVSSVLAQLSYRRGLSEEEQDDRVQFIVTAQSLVAQGFPEDDLLYIKGILSGELPLTARPIEILTMRDASMSDVPDIIARRMPGFRQDVDEGPSWDELLEWAQQTKAFANSGVSILLDVLRSPAFLRAADVDNLELHVPLTEKPWVLDVDEDLSEKVGVIAGRYYSPTSNLSGLTLLTPVPRRHWITLYAAVLKQRSELPLTVPIDPNVDYGTQEERRDQTWARSLVHEYTHSASLRLLDSDPKFKNEITRLMDVVKATLPENDILKYYGLTSEREFVSELFSDGRFQTLLLTISDPRGPAPGPPQSIWQSFLRAIREVITRVRALGHTIADASVFESGVSEVMRAVQFGEERAEERAGWEMLTDETGFEPAPPGFYEDPPPGDPATASILAANEATGWGDALRLAHLGEPLRLFHWGAVPFVGDRFEPMISEVLGATQDLGPVLYVSHDSKDWQRYAKTGFKKLSQQGGRGPGRAEVDPNVTMSRDRAEKLGLFTKRAVDLGITAVRSDDWAGKPTAEIFMGEPAGDEGRSTAYQTRFAVTFKKPFVFGSTKPNNQQLIAALKVFGVTNPSVAHLDALRSALEGGVGFFVIPEALRTIDKATQQHGAPAQVAGWGETDKLFTSMGYDGLFNADNHEIALLSNSDYVKETSTPKERAEQEQYGRQRAPLPERLLPWRSAEADERRRRAIEKGLIRPLGEEPTASVAGNLAAVSAAAALAMSPLGAAAQQFNVPGTEIVTTFPGLIDYLKKYEGIRLDEDGLAYAYPDKRNGPINTIGYGHHLIDGDNRKFEEITGVTVEEALNGARIDLESAEKLLRYDIDVHWRRAQHAFPGMDTLTPLVQRTLIDLTFWSVYPHTFKKSAAAVRARDWDKAMREITTGKQYIRLLAEAKKTPEKKITQTLERYQNALRAFGLQKNLDKSKKYKPTTSIMEPMHLRAGTRTRLMNWWAYSIASDAAYAKDMPAATRIVRARMDKLFAGYEQAEFYEDARQIVIDGLEKKMPGVLPNKVIMLRKSLVKWARANLPTGDEFTELRLDHDLMATDTPPTHLPLSSPRKMAHMPEQLAFPFYADTKDYAPGDLTASVASAAEMFVKLTPLPGLGTPGLEDILHETSNFMSILVAKEGRLYKQLTELWGHGPSIVPFVHRKLPADPTDRKSGETIESDSPKLLRDLRRKDKLTDEERQLVLLVMATDILEYGGDKAEPDFVAGLAKAKVIVNVKVSQVKEQLESLKSVVPPRIYERMVTAERAVRAEYSRADAPAQYAEELEKAGVGIAYSVDGKPVELLWTVPAQWIQDELDHPESTYKKKMIENGRKAEDLTIPTIAKSVYDMLKYLGEELNKHAPWFMSSDSPYMHLRKNYFPHLPGGQAFLGREEREVFRDLERDIEEVQKEKAEQAEKILANAFKFDAKGQRIPRPLKDVTDKMLRYLFDLKKIVWVTRDQAILEIKDGKHRDKGISPRMTFADVVMEIKRSIDAQLISRKLNKEKLDGRIMDATGERTAIEDPMAFAKALRTMMPKFHHREFSGRTRARTGSSTLQFDYKQHGKKPSGIGMVEIMHRYAADILTATMNKVTLNQMVLTTHATGAPLIIPDPNLDFGDDPMSELLSESTWNILADRLGRHAGMPRAPGDTGKEHVAKVVAATYGKDKTRQYTYTKSPYPSIRGFYTLHEGTKENVLDAVLAGGEVAGILKQVLDDPWRDAYGIMETLEHVNTWMKVMALQASLFFPIAGLESLSALSAVPLSQKGINIPVLKHLQWPEFWSKGGIMELVRWRRMIVSQHPYAMGLMEQAKSIGIIFSETSNPFEISMTTVEKDAEGVRDWVNKHVGAGGNFFYNIMMAPQVQTRMIFDGFFNTAKLWAVFHMSERLKAEAAARGETFDFKRDMAPFASYIDGEIGGTNTNRYSWLTPTQRRNMGLTLFSWNWTIGAWNAGGGGILTSGILKNYLTPEEARHIQARRWPAMFMYILFLIPAMVQGAAFMFGAAVDDDDERENDELFIWNNEDGRKLHADLTPILRNMFWYEGAPTKERRQYIHWGKQAYEVQRWLESPWNSLMSKLSQVARLGVELATGEAAGASDWDLPYKDMGLAGWLIDDEGQWSGSRTGHIFKKFMPFSLLGWARNPDAAPFQLFGPTSKGISFNRATDAYQGFLETWAQKDTYSQFYKNRKIKANLDALGHHILEAAEINGYDPQKVIDSAMGAVVKDIYRKLYKAIDRNDIRKIEEYGVQIARLNGTVSRIRSSVRNRNNLYGKGSKLTDDQNRLIKLSMEMP